MSKDLKIGFALLTHSNAKQIYRLTSLLTQMFPGCEISWHHDFKKEPSVKRGTLPNIRLVNDYISPSWGRFSIVEAGIKALRNFRNSAKPPDWIYLLSGSDFPVKPSHYITNFLRETAFDVFVSHVNLSELLPQTETQKDLKFRYFYEGVFPTKYTCFAGEQWFAANMKAVNFLLETVDNSPDLIAHYKLLESTKGAICPDESFYHTIFCNSSNLNISNSCLTYIDWSENDSSPSTLEMGDFGRIVNSSAHFARKFDSERDDKILNALETFCFSVEHCSEKLNLIEQSVKPKSWMDVYFK